jgi:hypothetical protein
MTVSFVETPYVNLLRVVLLALSVVTRWTKA